MKTCLYIIIAALLANLMVYMLIEAWDKEETAREHKTAEYVKALRK